MVLDVRHLSPLVALDTLANWLSRVNDDGQKSKGAIRKNKGSGDRLSSFIR